jgi:hypothetical protein
MSNMLPVRPGGHVPVTGTRPVVGRSPNRPQNAAGTRIEPPPSVPIPAADASTARIAASPPLDPPGVRAGSNGCSVRP